MRISLAINFDSPLAFFAFVDIRKIMKETLFFAGFFSIEKYFRPLIMYRDEDDDFVC
jgi:hypothetical protein